MATFLLEKPQRQPQKQQNIFLTHDTVRWWICSWAGWQMAIGGQVGEREKNFKAENVKTLKGTKDKNTEAFR